MLLGVRCESDKQNLNSSGLAPEVVILIGTWREGENIHPIMYGNF